LDPDRTLVDQAAAGSRDAFDELVRRYHGRIYTLARVMTNGDAEAEDLVQEAFVRAFRGISRFRGESAFGTWMHRIAVNVIKSHLVQRSRRSAAAPLQERSDGGESLMEACASGEDLETAVVRRQAIDRALAELPVEQRLLVVLRDVQGLEYHEIAALTELPIGTVESRIFRARQRLRPMLESLMGRSLC
jgi:RNA polymerase sigma-70 factor, ECF subfamily